MLLLEDHSLEIPPFLQRNEDGSMKYPKAAYPRVTKPVTPTPDEEKQLNRWGWPLDRWGCPINPADEKARREIDAEQARTAKERKDASAEKAKVERAKREEIKQRALQAQRKTFLEHFKWDWEK